LAGGDLDYMVWFGFLLDKGGLPDDYDRSNYLKFGVVFGDSNLIFLFLIEFLFIFKK
jgi:hypothetical protein